MRHARFTGITFTIVIALMLTTTIAIGSSSLLKINNASAQQTLNTNATTSYSPQGHNMMQMNKGMISNPLLTMTPISNFTGSISIFSPIINAYKSYIHVSLSDAIATAEKSIGNNSTITAAFIHPDMGFIVYNIFALDSNNNVQKVIVDPGNGKILLNQQMSFMEMMMMLHGGGSGSIGNWMMGPQGPGPVVGPQGPGPHH